MNGCNDGDVYVGAVLVKTSPNSKTDATCNIYETYGPDGVANGAGPGGADEQKFDNFIIADVRCTISYTGYG